jgi:hypothetical protein
VDQGNEDDEEYHEQDDGPDGKRVSGHRLDGVGDWFFLIISQKSFLRAFIFRIEHR